MDEKKLAWRGARRGKEQRVLRRGGLRLSGQRKGLQQQGQVPRWRGRQEFREPGPGPWLLDYRRSVVDGAEAERRHAAVVQKGMRSGARRPLGQ